MRQALGRRLFEQSQDTITECSVIGSRLSGTWPVAEASHTMLSETRPPFAVGRDGGADLVRYLLNFLSLTARQDDAGAFYHPRFLVRLLLIACNSARTSAEQSKEAACLGISQTF